MKSSEKFKENCASGEASREFLSNSPLYSLLALYMPVTIFAALIFIIQAFFLFSFNSALFIICALLSGISASLYCDFMKDIKSSQTAANIRGGIIIVVFFYAFSSLFRHGIPIKEKFFPHFINITSVIGALYSWIYVISLKRIFSARKRFETYSQMYQGKKLQQILYEDSSFLQYTDENINKEKFKYLVQLVIIGILTIVCTILKIIFPFSLYILLVVMFISAILICSFLEMIKWEHYFSAEGISLSAQDRTKRTLSAAIISFICLTAALLIASNESILPFSLITGFLSWFFSLFRSDRGHVSESNQEIQMGMEMTQPMLPFDEIAGLSEPSKIMEYIKTVLKYGLIILAVTLFVLFMVSPLLNRGKVLKNMTFGQKLARIFMELFRGILSGFIAFFKYLKHGKTMSKLRKYNAEEIRRASDSLFSAYSMAKKKDMKQSVTLFARLILWGSDVRKVTWQPYHAPGEFCAILSDISAEYEAAPKDSVQNSAMLNEGIIRCGEIFEKALYSFEALSNEERKEFKYLVEDITSSPY